MKLTIVYPAIGHRIGESYLRTWQMEPLPVATLAGLMPADADITFYDDRLETIDFDRPADAVLIPIETYTARRAYEIASEYRRRNVPVVMGGFHATLMPDEVARFAEAVVIGEAESIWHEVIDDIRHGTLKSRYRGNRDSMSLINPDRRLFRGKKYLPIGLVETGRGCPFPCEFCAVQTFFDRSYRMRPVDAVIAELSALKQSRRVFFFVDDNFAGNMRISRELLPELTRLNIRWITQMSIHAAHDEAYLALLSQSGCKGVLIGFESLDECNLERMNKQFNTAKGGYETALANLRKYNIRVYGTFVFGYDNDTEESFDQAVEFAIGQGMYIAAFNHLTPFPGTELYARLQQEGKLRFDAWWLDPGYRYNELPFVPERLSPEAVTKGCVEARRKFYGWPSTIRRFGSNRGDGFMSRNYFPINAMHRNEISKRNGYPLGDENWQGQLLERT